MLPAGSKPNVVIVVVVVVTVINNMGSDLISFLHAWFVELPTIF
jgi:hypothetical protein